MAEASLFNAEKINQASHLVVFTVIDQIAIFETQIQKHLPKGSVDYYNQFLKAYPPAELKNWMQHQVYLSLGFFLAACANLEIDSTPMEGIEQEKYNAILDLKDYTSLFAVAIGYRNPQDANQPILKNKSRLPLEEVVFTMD